MRTTPVSVAGDRYGVTVEDPMGEASIDGALAEFASLRAEMDSRSKYQQQILALQLTLTSAVFAFGLATAGLLGIIMIVPLSSYLLCGRYVGQRTAIRWAASYIIDQLSPRVPGGLNWSGWARRNRRPDRLLDWFVPLLICFPGASLLALGWTFPLVTTFDGRSIGATIGLLSVWILGVFATSVSAYLLARVFLEREDKHPSAEGT